MNVSTTTPGTIRNNEETVRSLIGKILPMCLVVFSILAVCLSWLDFLPEPPTSEPALEQSLSGGSLVAFAQENEQAMIAGTSTSAAVEASESPVSAIVSSQEEAAGRPDVTPRRIVIDSIGVNVSVSNPLSTNIEILDTALLDGVVRYPGSGDLNDVSNMLIFGHSSSLPVIYNQNFKVFNRLKDLTQGDVIRVKSNTHEHVYRVTSVRLTRAEEALVSFDTTSRKLTLSTCNTFGEKSERYVVEAEFVGEFPL